MTLNTSFTVIARCLKFQKTEYGHAKNLGDSKEDIELVFDIEKALRFLIRFYDNGMIIDGYKVLFSKEPGRRKTTIYLYKNEYVYIVVNDNQLVNDILRGYNYLITMDKVIDIMDFDFKAAIDIEDVEDEYVE